MAKDKNYGEEIDLKKYEDKDDVTLREMSIGLWLSENRHMLIRLLVIFLILVSATFFIYSAYQFYIYYKSGSDNSILVDNNIISPRNVTTDLKIESPQYIKSNEKYDLYVKVTNPNDKFSAKFSACFNFKDIEFSCANSFILPGETKYIYALGKDIKEDISGLSFKANNISWQRLDAHAIPDWQEFSSPRLNFVFKDINLYSLSDATYISGGNGNILEFNAQNLSPYSYYNIPLNIALFDGSQVVSINTYQLQNFLSGETRNIKINWPGDFRNFRVEIMPSVNILDSSVYLKYQGSKN